jgi:hypothetical protein
MQEVCFSRQQVVLLLSWMRSAVISNSAGESIFVTNPSRVVAAALSVAGATATNVASTIDPHRLAEAVQRIIAAT